MSSKNQEAPAVAGAGYLILWPRAEGADVAPDERTAVWFEDDATAAAWVKNRLLYRQYAEIGNDLQPVVIRVLRPDEAERTVPTLVAA